MKVNPELFVIPKQDNFILYLPLENRTAMEVTPGVLTILKNASSITEKDSSDGLVKRLLDRKLRAKDVTVIGTLYSTGTISGITAAAVPKAPNPALAPTRMAWTLLLKPMLRIHLRVSYYE